MFQQLTHYWSDSYLKKRSLENFFHLMFAFTYFMPVPHVRFIYAKATHSSFLDPLTINSSSASRKTVYNTSLFQKNGLYFKKVLRYHDPAYIALNCLPAQRVGLNKLVPWGALFDKNVYGLGVLSSTLVSKRQQLVLFSTLTEAVFRLVLHMVLSIRRVAQTLALTY